MARALIKDGIDLSTVQVHNSPNVKDWPATSTITKIDFRPSGVHVEHTKNQGSGAWPNFRPPGWDGDLQYTLWIFLNIGGQWHGSGCIQFWQSCDQNGGPPEQFARNWYYAADRWAPMTGYQPTQGEPVGFMVTAGDARNNGVQSVRERSNVVLMPFPVSGGSYTDTNPPPPPPPPPDDLAARVAQLEAQYNDLKGYADSLFDHATALDRRVTALEAKPAVSWLVAWRGQAKTPLGAVTVVVDTPMTQKQLDDYKAGK